MTQLSVIGREKQMEILEQIFEDDREEYIYISIEFGPLKSITTDEILHAASEIFNISPVKYIEEVNGEDMFQTPIVSVTSSFRSDSLHAPSLIENGAYEIAIVRQTFLHWVEQASKNEGSFIRFSSGPLEELLEGKIEDVKGFMMIRRGNETSITNEEILKNIREISNSIGGRLLSKDNYKENNPLVQMDSIYRRFSSWPVVKQMAGVK